MTTDRTTNQEERRLVTRQNVRVAVWLLLVVALVVFALLNTEDANVDWLFGDSDSPLIVVIAVSAAIGFLLGAITVARRRRRD